MLKAEKLEEAQLAGKRHSTHIMTLQKQMEKEMLNSRNIQHQLDMERVNTARLAEKYNSLLKQTVSSLGSPYSTPVYHQTPSNNCNQFINPSSNVSSSSMVSTVAAMAPSLPTSSTSIITNRVNSMDSFAMDSMRSIWNSPKKQQVAGTANTARRSDQRQNFSSSAGSILLTKPPPSAPPQSTTMPPPPQSNSLFSTSPFDYGGLFNPMSVISTTTSTATSASTTSSNSQGSYGNHKCL